MAEDTISEHMMQLAQQAAQIESLQNGFSEMQTDMKALSANVSAIKEMMAEARGGWRMLLLIGGGIAALGAAMAGIAAFIARAIDWFGFSIVHK